MTGDRSIVVDASLALAWGLPDEMSIYADTVLAALEGIEMLVPPLWPVEIANALAVAERRQRIGPSDIELFIELLGNLTIREEASHPVQAIRDSLTLAREYGLTAYDASYLHTAIRHGAPLATLDEKLKEAGYRAGAKIFGE